jgi:polysaccharide chain length determinant protein (PEP-CTERM system associated)
VTLYADVTNIIGNLLEGKAEITKIDRAKEARDIVFTDRILRSVAVKAGFSDPDSAIGILRSRMKITANGDYVYISYSSSSRDMAFNVIDAVTQAFLSETSRKKREESQSAFDFIDAQVSKYKQQLELAEQALKEFSAQNIDITEASVSKQVIQYKKDLNVLQLEIEDTEARLASYEKEIAGESEFLEIESKPEPTFEERQLEAFQHRLAELRLSFLDTHPDIISLKDQIAALEVEVEAGKNETDQNTQLTKVENPAHTDLKAVINSERANLNALKNRLTNTEILLRSELSNAEMVADKQATYKELTRDYSVTKDVYEDMLKRRESARLSMTLDIEGQGVTYKIHEPASYPIRSNGLQLIHYAVIGPVLGMAAPLGLIVLLVIVDPRIRSASFMEDKLPTHINLMTTIPMYNSAVGELASKRSLVLIGLVMFLYISAYAMLSVGREVFAAIGMLL